MSENKFTAKDQSIVLLRAPRQEDLDGLLDFINSLVREKAPINKTSEVSRSEEDTFLRRQLASIASGDVLHLVAEINGRIVGSAEVSKLSGRESHVGTLGIGVKSGYRRIGIATKLIETLTQRAKHQGLKIILLAVYENNVPAITLYRKLGFKEIGRTPKGVYWEGKYIDDIKMAKAIG
jgi:ribosomal protein S18 acetylase RimI-like enzyme